MTQRSGEHENIFRSTKKATKYESKRRKQQRGRKMTLGKIILHEGVACVSLNQKRDQY